MQDLRLFFFQLRFDGYVISVTVLLLYGPTTMETKPSESQDRVRAGCQQKQGKDANTSFLSPSSSLLKTQSY